MSVMLPEDYSAGMPGHVEAHEAVNAQVNRLTSGLSEALGPSDLNALRTELTDRIKGALGRRVADDAGVFQGERPDHDVVVWVGKDSSSYTGSQDNDIRLRVADGEW